MLDHARFPLMPHAGARLRLRIFVAATALALAAGGCARDGAARPGANVLLVTLDTVRADRVGCYGGAVATPALDRLAREGVRFAQASSPAPLTLPAHASLLSGLLPPAHGLRNNGAGAFPADRPTLATALAARGYRTAAFLGAFVLDRRFGLDRGFATYDDEIERGPDTAPSLEAERRGDRVVDRALAWLERPGRKASGPSSSGSTSTTRTRRTRRRRPSASATPGVPTTARWPSPTRRWAGSSRRSTGSVSPATRWSRWRPTTAKRSASTAS